MKTTIAGLVFTCLLPLMVHAQESVPGGTECQGLGAHLGAGAMAVTRVSEPAGPRGFQAFRQAVAGSARKAGDADLAGRIEALESGKPVPPESAHLASCLVRRYLIARYGDRIVSDLQEMLAFRTFATEGKENWGAPEFAKQAKWLEGKARRLGLEFKSFDGRVEEITLPKKGDLKPVLAILTHGDVQGVEGQHWSSSPWEGKIVNGRIVGRGTEDDKGPIIVTLYSMAALRDTGWPLGWSLRLLVANGEESSWEEIPYYLQRAPMPDRTLGVDANYPVTHAQKGYGLLSFHAEPVETPKAGSWRVVKMSGGSGNSIIPERGEAVVEWVGEGSAADLSAEAARWVSQHPDAKLTVSREGNLLKVAAEGRGGHTSEPTSGHNALGDLTAFLATLDLRLDAWGGLASFVGTRIGTETDGASLGIAHADPVMGELTSCLVYLLEEEGKPTARVNIRVPRGITAPEMEKSLAERTAAFQGQGGGKVSTAVQLLSEPHLTPAEGEVVSGLLEVWKEVTGTEGQPIAIGGGTQARLFQGGVDFGPAWPGKPYRGHGTDEYLTIDELHRIGELTVAALWRLGR
ncbi:MAG TPA: Sapep family Mn(2+)-dependent dipeptidase [Thermoanaerobaculia bacterium]|jgi:dipeptidase D|nr:Sapep family Mn(2+)-dependent dipeptidase [Thermoanaerobaculia bacterium]